MLDVVPDLLAAADAPESRDQADSIIRLDHDLPLTLLRSNARQAGERHGQFLLVVVLIDEFAFEVIDVGLHVEMAVTGKVEQDRFLLPSFLQRRASSIAQRTAWFASGAGTMPSQ